MKRAWLVAAVLLQACECAKLPEGALYQCEADGACAQPGYVCREDGLCHAPEEDDDAGVDAGAPDGGEDDAGLPDAGVDDAGVDDAGLPDAGVPDAGEPDAGCVPTGAIDEPDDQQLDVNCDGFDGDLARAVFVDPMNGDDTHAGTRDEPVRTLTEALMRDREQVYLATGTSTVSTLQVDDAVAIYGGYDATGWSRTPMLSVVQGRVWAAPADGGRVVLEQLDVQPPAVTQRGVASVAVTLVGAAASSRIARCRLSGGVGGDGADGENAGAAANGSTGGAATAAGDGGLGAPAVSCGDAGVSFAGLRGGSGGASATLGIGTDGEDATLGGEGGGETTCEAPPCVGLDGGAGLAGAAGAVSTSRAADPPATFLGGLDGGVWFGARLSTWTPAAPGRGGGGGGGGGALLTALGELIAHGGGAGGGGSGGCGARSGTAGQAGGASISLVLWASSPALRDVQLVGGAGGRGGDGGGAGAPGAGGAGAVGGAGPAVPDAGTPGVGGRGGNGGAGGAGRQGPGGWGGPLIGVFCGAGAAPDLDATTTWQAGTPGVAGDGDPNGRGGGEPASGFTEGCP